MGKSYVRLLEPSLWEQALFNPSERNKIAALTEKHGSIKDGILDWVYQTKKERHG